MDSVIENPLRPRSPLVSFDTTHYVGSYETKRLNFHRLNLPGGYVSVADTVYHWYLTDYQGNISGVVNTVTKELEQYQDYYPYGKPHDTAVDASDNRRKFGGKELITDKGYDAYDFEARPLTLTIPRFTQPDNKAENYYPTSIYAYCGGDPINRIDENGEAWEPTVNTQRGIANGFRWIDEEQSYNPDGSLKHGLYHQAIFFLEGGTNGTFDENSKFNMGTSTAYVYREDGTIMTFDACTHPYNSSKAATVPDGLYEAAFGKHHNKPALNLNRVGDKSREIDLVYPNPNKQSSNYGKEIATGINVHWAGVNNLTGSLMRKDGTEGHVSEGCLVIDIQRWPEFIMTFANSAYKEFPIAVIVSRFLQCPENRDVDNSTRN